MIAQGTRLGPYEIVSFLAAGGMGEVYRGHDARLGRAVAIKVLPEAAFSDSEAVLRFEREARAAAAMSHPNLIAIHDVGRAGDLHYLVMDLLEGETLRQRLSGGALPWTKAVELAVSVTAGIAAVHAKGFVHRDLKPENIFLTADGWVKLLDFGLAVPPRRASGPLAADDPTMRAVTRKGFLVGTLAYMSPEQLREEEIDGRADIFALGCVLYEMLAGQSPFLRDSRAETCAAILSDRPVVLPPSVPAPVVNVVQRCLQRDRERRYSSASEAMGALRRVDAGKWVSGPRQPCPEQSIAVLPFSNLSGEKENDYFGDGLAEEIRNSLTSVPGLKVTARTSALVFRGKEIDVRMIGQALGVRAILEGSVRRVGNQVRVTAQLIDTANGYHLWSARFDRAMTDVFAVQDEIAAAIADTLKLRLGGEGAQRARRTNVDAYHAYLKSRYHFSKLTPERLALSRAYAEEAIDADPDYPAAQAQLAECFIQTALYGMSSPREMMPLARDAALKAVAGDAGEASAQLALARIAGEYDHDWTEALRRCRLALASERILPAVRALCAQYILWPLGRLDELTEALRPALDADPLSPMPRTVYAHALATGGAIDRSLDEFRGVLELHDQFWPGYFAAGFLLTVMKRTSEAITAFEKSLRIAPWNAAAAGFLEGNLLRAGLGDRVDGILAELNVSGRARRAPLALTSMHFAAGQYERAAEHFARVIDDRYPVAAHHLTWLCVDNAFRTSPAGRALRERMKLPA